MKCWKYSKYCKYLNAGNIGNTGNKGILKILKCLNTEILTRPRPTRPRPPRPIPRPRPSQWLAPSMRFFSQKTWWWMRWDWQILSNIENNG